MVGKSAVSDISLHSGIDDTKIGPKSIIDDIPSEITEFLDSKRGSKQRRTDSKSSKYKR